MSFTTSDPIAPSGLSLGERVCWLFFLAGFSAASAPFLFPEFFDSWRGGQYALVMLGALAGFGGLICSFLFRGRRIVLTNLLKDETLIARWRIDDDSWKRFIEKDSEQERRIKWALLRLVFGIAFGVGLVFFLLDPRGGGAWVMTVLMLVSAACLIALQLSIKHQRSNRLASRGDVRISSNGLLLGRELHVWHGFGARLEKCVLSARKEPVLEFVYTIRARTHRQFHSVRVPVPANAQEQAERVVSSLRPLCGKW